MPQVILPLGFCVVFFEDLYEKTKAVTAGFDIASRAISFPSIKPIVSLTFFSSRFSHPSTSLRISSSAKPVTMTSFRIMSVKSIIWLQPSFGHLHVYEHVLAFPFKRAANDLVFSVKSCLALRKSDRRTTTETGITASCLIILKSSCSLKFTTSSCPFRIASPRSSSQHWYSWRPFSTSVISMLSLKIVHFCTNIFQPSSLQYVPIRGRSIFGGFGFEEFALMWTLLWMISKEATTEASTSGFSYVQLSRGHLITGIVDSI